MTRHASNSDRIARAAAEAEAAAHEKMKAKRAKAMAAAKEPPRSRSGAKARAAARMKVVWAVGRPGLEPVMTFPYPARGDADAEAGRRGSDFRVVALKVPME